MLQLKNLFILYQFKDESNVHREKKRFTLKLTTITTDRPATDSPKLYKLLLAAGDQTKHISTKRQTKWERKK